MKDLIKRGGEYLKKSFVGSCEFNFDKNEKFAKVNDKTFISSNGRCLMLNSQGYFKERAPFKTNRGTLQVSFITNDDKQKTDLIAYMVLRNFIGGYYKQRRINYINGDKTDCRLSNLEWLDGFQNGVDKFYLKELKNKHLEFGDLQVKNILLNNQDWILIDYINKYSNYFQKILYEDFKNVIDLDTVLDEIYQRAINDIKLGKYIPLSKYSKKYKKRNDDRLLYFLRVKCLDFLYHYKIPDKIQVIKKSMDKYVDIDDYDAYFSSL